MSEQTITFNAWMHALRKLAAHRDLTWILGDADSNKDAFSDGLTPDDALNSMLTDAKEA
jgi:hypothetical protein